MKNNKFCFLFCVDLHYLQDLLKLTSDNYQMKVTVRQLRGRPGTSNWHPLLQQLRETGISKFLIDVSTDNLDDFFQHVRMMYDDTRRQKKVIVVLCCFKAKIVGLVGPYYDFVLTSLVNSLQKLLICFF